MASHRIKIAARLRPPLPGEITDHDIVVHHSSDESIDSVDGSYISVANPRDASQIFKFAYVVMYLALNHMVSQEKQKTDFLAVMVMILHRRKFSSMM